MTDREKAIVMAYTGYTMLTGDKLGIFYDYVKEKLGRYIMTHELAYDEAADEIKRAAKDDFFALCMHNDTAMEAPTVGGWISVKDRPPETRHAVLVYTPHYKNTWAASMREDGNWYIWSPGGGVLLDPDWHGPITHWMPLPEPPKEVSEE